MSANQLERDEGTLRRQLDLSQTEFFHQISFAVPDRMFLPNEFAANAVLSCYAAKGLWVTQTVFV